MHFELTGTSLTGASLEITAANMADSTAIEGLQRALQKAGFRTGYTRWEGRLRTLSIPMPPTPTQERRTGGTPAGTNSGLEKEPESRGGTLPRLGTTKVTDTWH